MAKVKRSRVAGLGALSRGSRPPARQGAEEALAAAGMSPGAVLVSPITAWEIGILVTRGRIALSREPTGWFQALIDAGVALAPMSPHMLVASSFLPGAALRDPADRILAATARPMNYRLMTRDQRILDLAAAGHLTAVACNRRRLLTYDRARPASRLAVGGRR